MGTDLFERRVVISGVGQSAIGRQVDRSGFQLTLDAIGAAVADAGLTLDDIDGLAMFPGGGAASLPGYANGNLYEVHDALRITTTWRQGIVEGMPLPFYGPAQAVATGQARHAVIWRTVKEGSAARNAGGRPAYGSTKPTADGPLAWLLPVGMLSPVVQVAPYFTRYLHEYGVTREQLAWIPVTQRAHAARNPDAVYRSPLTVEDYLAARMISSPICLYDCDVPADGATAIVVSAIETAPDLRSPVRIEAMAGVVEGRPQWDQWEDMGRVGHGAAQAMWARTDLGPATSTWPSCTTASRSRPSGGSRPWASASRARPARSWTAAPASPWTANCRSTPGAASCPAAACTRPSATPPRRSASCAARRATARSRARRSPRSPTPAASRRARRCSPAGK
jgi:acetyl-CoA acetyltransferase